MHGHRCATIISVSLLLVASVVLLATEAPASTPVPEAAPSMTDAAQVLRDLATAAVLLAAAAMVLAIEFMVVSFGLLSLISLGLAIWSLVIAFGVSPLAGWSFVGACPVIATGVCWWGLHRVRHSALVARGEISGSAGYHEAAEQAGVAVGSLGVLVTPSRPMAKAAFAAPGSPTGQRELDVLVEGASLPTGTAVVVRRIEGPEIHVAPCAAHRPSTHDPSRSTYT